MSITSFTASGLVRIKITKAKTRVLPRSNRCHSCMYIFIPNSIQKIVTWTEKQETEKVELFVNFLHEFHAESACRFFSSFVLLILFHMLRSNTKFNKNHSPWMEFQHLYWKAVPLNYPPCYNSSVPNRLQQRNIS